MSVRLAQGASEKAARTTSWIEEEFAGAWVNAVHHERGDGARGVILACVAGVLQVVEYLFVNVAKMLALG